MAKLFVLFTLCVLPALAVATRPMRTPFTVEGKVYCDTCRAGFETSATTYIPGNHSYSNFVFPVRDFGYVGLFFVDGLEVRSNSLDLEGFFLCSVIVSERWVFYFQILLGLDLLYSRWSKW